MILCAAIVRRSGEPGPAPTSVSFAPFGNVFGGLLVLFVDDCFCSLLLLPLILSSSLLTARVVVVACG